MSLRPLFLGAILLAAWPARAQPASPSSTVSLSQVMQAARENLDVSLARRALAAAQADVASADHAPAPVLSAKAASIDLQNGVGTGNLLRDKRIDKSLGIDWTWERGNKRELRTRAAKFSADAAQADLQEVQVQQQLAAAGAYYDLMAAQERIAHVEAIARSAADLSTTAQRRVGAGDLSRQEALRTEIEAQRAGSEVRSAQAERQKAAAAMSLLTGLPQPFSLVADWPALDAAVSGMPDVELRADVRAAQQRLAAAGAALDGALALRRADVTLGSSIDHFPGTSTRQLEVRLQLPLIGVLGSYGFEGEIGRARVLMSQSQDQLEKTQRAAAADSQRLQQELQVSATRSRTYQEAIVPRARQVASMSELAYRQGAMSLADLIDARRTLRTALLEDVASRADHARALAAWQLRAGPDPR
ncbi:MAG: TolC family protein [Ramlibacter sp.]|nr:TolC family protein [Ramlibacter sp.]